jgi:hypothetical protein
VVDCEWWMWKEALRGVLGSKSVRAFLRRCGDCVLMADTLLVCYIIFENL